MEPMTVDVSEIGPLTDDALLRLCVANRDLRFERTSAGNLIVMSPTGGRSGLRSGRLFYALARWNEETGLGLAFDSSTGFRLPSGAMRAPDAAWVARARWDQLSDEEQDGFPPLCPDFVIELMSESDRLAPMQEKMEEWMANGCRLAWLLQPKDAHAFVYQAGGGRSVVDSFDDVLSGEAVLPGFGLHLAGLR